MLSHQELKFCHTYTKTLDAKQAALEVGYSEGMAACANSWMIPGRRDYKPEICDYVNHLLRAQRQRIDMDADAVIQEIIYIASANLADVVFVDGTAIHIRSFDEIPYNTKVAIAEAQQTVTEHGGTLRVKMHDKLGALNLLARHYGLLKDTVVLDAGGEALKAVLQAIDGGTKGLPMEDKNPYNQKDESNGKEETREPQPR